MKENAVKCPTCLIPIVFYDFVKVIHLEEPTEYKAVYKCPQCGWYK